jgi:hypothetical protein
VNITLSIIHDRCAAPSEDKAGNLSYPEFIVKHVDDFMRYLACPNCDERISLYVRSE